jgi:hypothetical protein
MRDSAGNFCNLQGFGLETHRKTPRDQAVMIEIPYAKKQGIFAADQGFWHALAGPPKQRILNLQSPWPWPCWRIAA